MSLIEVVITVGVFSIFSLLVTALVVSAARNYQRGKLMHEVRRKTESVLRMMTDDIRRGHVLKTTGSVNWTTGSSGWIPSAVLLPNPYGETGSTGDLGEGKSKNRLVVVVPAQSIDALDMSNPNTGLRMVEYLVTEEEPNRIYRRSYLVTEWGDYYKGYTKMGDKWIVDDTYFTDTTNIQRGDILAELEGAKDLIEFTVERPKLTQIDTSYGVDYERHLFDVKVKMTRFQRNDTERPISYEEETKVKTTVK